MIKINNIRGNLSNILPEQNHWVSVVRFSAVSDATKLYEMFNGSQETYPYNIEMKGIWGDNYLRNVFSEYRQDCRAGQPRGLVLLF